MKVDIDIKGLLLGTLVFFTLFGVPAVFNSIKADMLASEYKKNILTVKTKSVKTLEELKIK